MLFKQSVPLILITLSIGSLASCGSKVAERSATTTTQPATTAGAIVKTTTTTATALPVVPAGTSINTDLQQELTSGKNRPNERFTLKVKNSSVSKYPALKDAVIEGHLQNVVKAAKGKKAQMNLFFDDIKLKNGDVLPIAANLVNTQVETKTKGQFLKNAGIILGGTVAGNFLGNKTNFKHGKLAGAAAATAYVLSSPGGEVVLKKGTDLHLKLKSNLDPN